MIDIEIELKVRAIIAVRDLWIKAWISVVIRWLSICMGKRLWLVYTGCGDQLKAMNVRVINCKTLYGALNWMNVHLKEAKIGLLSAPYSVLQLIIRTFIVFKLVSTTIENGPPSFSHKDVYSSNHHGVPHLNPKTPYCYYNTHLKLNLCIYHAPTFISNSLAMSLEDEPTKNYENQSNFPHVA